MAWTIKYTIGVQQQLRKMDRQAARRVVDFMDERVTTLEDPRSIGKALSGPLATLWRYRIGDYRIVASIEDSTVCILVVRIGNRKEVYR